MMLARILTVGLILLPMLATGQYVTVMASADGYRGDLNLKKGGVNGSSLSFGYNYEVEDGLLFRSQLNTGRFSSEYMLGNADVVPNPFPYGLNPTLYFENRHLGLEFSLLYEVVTFDPLTLYGGLGIGFMSYRVFDRDGRRLERQSQSRISGETYDGLAFTSPITVGILLFKGMRAQIALEQQWVLTNTDYLDNIGYAGARGDDRIVRRSLIVRFGL